MALRSLNDWVVKLLLLPVDGVTDVLSFGGEVRQYQVRIDPSRLLAYHLSVEEVAAAIEANNRNAGGWYVDQGAEQLVIRGVGWVRSGADGLRDIANVPLKDEAGVAVRVRDLARVAFGPEIRQGAVTMTVRGDDGTPHPLGEVVAGIVLKRIGANTKATIDGIKARLPIIRAALPAGVTLEPFYDQADLVNQAVTTVARALGEAFVLIVAVLLLFLFDLRATLLVLISVPISIGLALMAMAYWGISANLMSLGGLAIGIGMMVDGSVVMMEHIFRHLSQPDRWHHPDTSEVEGEGAARGTTRPRHPGALRHPRRPGDGPGLRRDRRPPRRPGDPRQRALRHRRAPGEGIPYRHRRHPRPGAPVAERRVGTPRRRRPGGGGVGATADPPRRRPATGGHPGERGGARHGRPGGGAARAHRP